MAECQNKINSILGVFLSIMALIIAGFYFLWIKITPPDPQIKRHLGKYTEKSDPESSVVLYPLETFIVNLADEDNPRYLRMSLVLELTGEEEKNDVIKHLSQIRNTILTIIPQKFSYHIITADGKTALIDEVMSTLNLVLKEVSISNIYFTEYIIQ